MSKTFKFARIAGTLILCLASFNLANADSARGQHKAKKPVLPPLPSGPTGPVPPMPLDSIAPVPPQVIYQNGQLTIIAPNSTLGDILRAVRKQTKAEIEIPEARERVVTRLGPGPARAVMAELLNGSRFNYVLLGSADDASGLTRVVLVAKTADNTVTNPANNPPMQQPQPVVNQAMNTTPTQEQIDDGEADESAPEENAEQPTEAEQPAPQGDQPEVKTPQQMLQEMQQRQLQMQQQQQQQQPGQPPIQVQPLPGRPPQEQQ